MQHGVNIDLINYITLKQSKMEKETIKQEFYKTFEYDKEDNTLYWEASDENYKLSLPEMIIKFTTKITDQQTKHLTEQLAEKDPTEKATYLIKVLGSKKDATKLCDIMIASDKVLDKEYYNNVKLEICKQ